MHSLKDNSHNLDKLFEKISDELDIPASLYKIAVERYSAVGNWLDEISLDQIFSGSNEPIPTEKISASIYPQGSFALGTVVKPWHENEEREYDIDLVFQLELPVGSKRPEALKKAVGERIREHKTYREMLKPEGRRCWTLNYSEQNNFKFHMDILPALNSRFKPSNKYQSNQITITDKKNESNYDWAHSNPKGYAEWFKEKNRIAFGRIAEYERSKIYAKEEAIFASVEEVPDIAIRTPLQRAIQILKRLRDKRFSGQPDEKEKPISMIITTLAAQLYDNEISVSQALNSIVHKLLPYKQLMMGQKLSNEQQLIGNPPKKK